MADLLTIGLRRTGPGTGGERPSLPSVEANTVRLKYEGRNRRKRPECVIGRSLEGDNRGRSSGTLTIDSKSTSEIIGKYR